jgi:hypothetical protein
MLRPVKPSIPGADPMAYRPLNALEDSLIRSRSPIALAARPLVGEHAPQDTGHSGTFPHGLIRPLRLQIDDYGTGDVHGLPMGPDRIPAKK